MGQVILPVNKNPPVKTYHHHAFGLGILTTNPEAMNWVYDNYILLSYYPKGGILTFDFYMDYIYCQPVFEREYLSDEMLKASKVNVMKYIHNALEREYYVVACVNEFYIPDREAYKTFSFQHNILIYGYDNHKKIFYTMGYNEKGKYTDGQVTYSEMKTANPNRIELLKIREGFEYKIHEENVVRQLKEFYGIQDITPVGSYPEEGRLVGMDALIGLKEYIHECIHKGDSIDIRPLSILQQHSKLMLARIKKCNAIDVKVVEIYTEIDKYTEGIYLKTLMYNIRISEKIGNEIVNIWSAFFEKEKEIKDYCFKFL